MASKSTDEVGQVKLKDSNMSSYGGKAHLDLRKKAAKADIQWRGSGKKPGVEIWRVENERAETSGEDKANFGIKKWPEDRHGEFFDGDSFIVLSTEADPKNDKKLRHDIYMWFGSDSTQDELGVAAYKTVELDDLHDGEPVQHRVVQGHEPKSFRDLFPNPIIVLSGGVNSGFNKVTAKEWTPRLLHVHGKKSIRVDERAATAMNMNHADVFILDAGDKLYQWNGRKSSPFERNKASRAVNQLRSERMGLAGIGKVDFEVIEDDHSKEKHDHFWAHIKGSYDDVKDSAGASNLKTSASKKRERVIYRISDRSGELTIKRETKDGDEFLMSSLDSGDVFVVDTVSEIFCWVGSKASREERAFAIPTVEKFMEKEGINTWTPVTRIDEGGRYPPAFKRAFSG